MELVRHFGKDLMEIPRLELNVLESFDGGLSLVISVAESGIGIIMLRSICYSAPGLLLRVKNVQDIWRNLLILLITLPLPGVGEYSFMYPYLHRADSVVIFYIYKYNMG